MTCTTYLVQDSVVTLRNNSGNYASSCYCSQYSVTILRFSINGYQYKAGHVFLELEIVPFHKLILLI